jgi:hypothetical protein
LVPLRASASRRSDEWSEEGYDVLADRAEVGRHAVAILAGDNPEVLEEQADCCLDARSLGLPTGEMSLHSPIACPLSCGALLLL